MKKLSKKKYIYTKFKNIREYKKSIKKANIIRNNKVKAHRFNKKLENNPEYNLIIKRKAFIRSFYKKRAFKDPYRKINIDGAYGLEEQNIIKYFLDISFNIINTKSKELLIDFTGCRRIWPSAIILLCSYAKWIELVRDTHHKSKIGSIASSDPKVNSYLDHCGFYEYVDIRVREDTSYYDKNEIVKIRREKKKSNIEERENEILELLQKYTLYDNDDIERFNSIILTEIFNNVTEHGIPNPRDMGWWILAQYHKNYQVISLCVADNGIGIKNSLLTGPQQHHLRKKIGNSPSNEHKYIEDAMEENISGAIQAAIKRKEDGRILFKTYASGARRGNGLKRIKSACKHLGIQLSILSNCGYHILDENGNLFDSNGFRKKIFAGTMYHLSIPARKVDDDATRIDS